MTISAKIGENVAKNIKTLNSLPRDYKKTINKIIDLINTARQKTLRVVNRSRIDLYWQIGSIIVQRQENFKWGEEVVEYISLDLQSRFPNLKGVSSRNLWRMRNFYLIYRNESELQSLCKEVGWSHNNAILDLTENRQEKEFYLRMCLRERWTVKELKKQIGSNLFSRYALAKEPEKILQDTLRKENNLDHHFKDEYLFDFLNLSSGYSEKDLCKALTIHMRNFLRELGRGFMFGGDEYNLRVGNEEFRIDMLFFHRELRCLIAVEFKKEHLDDFDYRDNIE